ncbi:hypothetical protein PQR67_14740 [Paraburkholderia fungorum]
MRERRWHFAVASLMAGVGLLSAALFSGACLAFCLPREQVCQ